MGSGFYDDFYAAVDRKDVAHVIEILKKVKLDDESIKMNLKFLELDLLASDSDLT